MNWVVSTLLIQIVITVVVSLVIILLFRCTHKDTYDDDI